MPRLPMAAQPQNISIHALLAESDHPGQPVRGLPSNFYPRSPCGERPILGNPCAGCPAISIHALLAESDRARAAQQKTPSGFLSTLSLRRATVVLHIVGKSGKFLSTLSLRRATWPGLLARPFFIISIHALLAESDNADCNCRNARPISIHALLAESDLSII